MPEQDVALSDNPAAHRFELRVAGTVAAYAEYNVLCQFIAGFMRKHPEYQDLVADEHRKAFGI